MKENRSGFADVERLSSIHETIVRFLVPLLLLSLALPGMALGLDAQGKYEFLNQVNRARYPHDHAVLSREVEHISFKDDGTSVDVDEVFLTMLDNDGVRRNSVQTFYINKHYSELELEFFEVIGPDGTVRPVDLSRYSKEDSSASTSRMNIYDPAQRELKVFVPELQPGDTIHYRLKRNTFKTMIPGQFFGRVSAEYTFPVREYLFEIKGPRGKRLHTLVKDARPDLFSHTTEDIGQGMQLHRYEFRNVPALVPEPSMPPFSRVAMRLLFSTIDTWGDVAQWYKGLVEPHLEPDDAIRQKVGELLQGTETDQEKIAALFYFVAQKVRYMGITAERDRPGYEPHDVSLTFSRRYGVCRDKAALLVTMLRLAGFHAVPVIISAGDKLDREVVVPWFNHAIVAIIGPDGTPSLYLDPTSETSRQYLPDYERDSTCLAATGADATLLLTPQPDARANMSLFQINDRLDEKGILSGTIRATFTGFCDTALRGRMMGSSHEVRLQTIEQLVLARLPGATVKDIRWSDPEDRSKPFSFVCSFTATNRLTITPGGELLFFPASSSRYIGVLDRFLLDRASLTERRYPLRLEYAVMSRMEENTILEVQDGLQPELPPLLSVGGNWIAAHRNMQLHGERLVSQRDFEIMGIEVPAEEYEEVLKVQREMADSAMVPVIFKSH